MSGSRKVAAIREMARLQRESGLSWDEFNALSSVERHELAQRLDARRPTEPVDLDAL